MNRNITEYTNWLPQENTTKIFRKWKNKGFPQPGDSDSDDESSSFSEKIKKDPFKYLKQYIRIYDKEDHEIKDIINYIIKICKGQSYKKKILFTNQYIALITSFQDTNYKKIRLMFNIILEIGVDPNILLYPEYVLQRSYNSHYGTLVRGEFWSKNLDRLIAYYREHYLPIAKEAVNKFIKSQTSSLIHRMPDEIATITRSFLTGSSMDSPRETTLPRSSMGFSRSPGKKFKALKKSK